MIKAEISEIKKLFKLSNCAITRICGCYVNGDKDIINTWSQNFLAMEEEDLYKYMDLFKKCLGGALNKTLFNINPSPNSCGKLHRLAQSKLKDDDLLKEFYEDIIDSYEYVGNYLILVIHDVYDIPGKASVTISMNKKTLLKGEVQVTQFGSQEGLAPVMFEDKKAPIKVYFYPETGAIKQIIQ